MRIPLLIFLSLFTLCAQAVNLIPNSSFEIGAARGWMQWQTAGSAFLGNTSTITGLIITDSVHGGHSMVVMGQTLGRGVRLDPGTYTHSFYAKRPAGSITLYYGLMRGNQLYGVLPPTNATITTSWARYTSIFTTTSNALFWPKFYPFASGIYVDAIQLEAGSSVSAYAPSATVECGISIPGTNNMFFSGGDSPKFTLNYWNTGSATRQFTRYDVFDSWNSNVISGLVAPTIAGETNSSTDVLLPTPLTGWFRVVSRLTTVNNSDDEASLVVYPYSSNSVFTSHSWLGGHPNDSPYNAHRDMLAYRTSPRTLSPGYLNTRWDFVEPTRGNFTFYDFGFTNFANLGMDTLGCLTPTDGYWPGWATNLDGTADMGAFSNFCWVVVSRYKTSCTNWEVGPNEPLQSGPHVPIDIPVATNYARALSAGISGVTNADPTARIIAMAGANGNGDWAVEVFTNLTTNVQSKIYAVSTHIYPSDVFPIDINDGEYPASRYSNADGWAARFGGVRPIWNTESGVWGGASLKGLNATWPANYDFQSAPAVEASRSEIMNRQLDNLVRILPQVLRCIGFGFEKYHYYDSRIFNDANFAFVNPYAASYEQVDRPEVVSISVAAHMVKRGFGSITNAQIGVYLEAYNFTNGSGNPVVATWSPSRTNMTLTLTNTTVAVYDAMGNQTIASTNAVIIRRVPQYLVNTSLTLGQFSNTVKYSTIALTTDTLAPQISFDIGPSGLWDGSTNRQLIKWTAIDDRVSAWVADPTSTNVVYRWKLDAGAYTDWNQSNHVWLANLASGNHAFYVSVMDSSGNSSERTYEFMPMRPTNHLAVAQTLRANTITLGP